MIWKYMTFMWPKKLLMDLAKGATNKHDKDPVTWRYAEINSLKMIGIYLLIAGVC